MSGHKHGKKHDRLSNTAIRADWRIESTSGGTRVDDSALERERDGTLVFRDLLGVTAVFPAGTYVSAQRLEISVADDAQAVAAQ